MAKKNKENIAKEVPSISYAEELTVKKDYIPEGFESKQAFLEDMRKQYALDVEFDRENRREILDDKKFAAGEQWDPIVLEHRQGLPCLVINSVPQFTAQLVGDFRESRRGIKVVPSENGDQNIASIRGDLIRAIEMQSRADRVYNNAFESTVQCGDGAFRVAVEYARDDAFDQDIFLRPIDDVLSTVWDRFSVDPTGRDAKRVYVDDVLPRDYVEKTWPGAVTDETFTENYMRDLTSEGWCDEDSFRVTEYWRMIERKRLLALFEDGSTRFIDNNIDELIEKHGPPLKVRAAPCLYAQMHICTGFEILAGPFEYRLKRLPIIRLSGRVVNVNGRRVRYGLVRFMKDPVRLRNFWRSVAAEQLGYAPKAQWMATESAVEGKEDTIRKAHLSRDPLIVLNDEAVIGQNVQRLDPPAPQMALLNEAQVNAQDMKDVTGLHDASLGIRSNEVSGRAINARQREGDIASLTFYDNANAAILEAGDVINQLISQIYDGTRIVRIVGEDEAIKFVNINDPNDPMSPDLSIGNYDVALSTGTSYSTRRVEAAQAMMDAVQVFPDLMSIAGDLVAKAQDWPGAEELAERLKKTVPPQFLDEEERQEMNVVDPMMQQLQMELQALQAENEQLKTDRLLDFEKLKIDKYNAETQRLRALSDHEVDNQQLQMEAMANILDASAKEEKANAPQRISDSGVR